MPRLDLELLLHRLVRRVGPRPGGEQADGLLLDRFAQQRDEAAFAALVERHGPLVYGVCRRLLGHHQDAEDAFQATFLILARRAGALDRAGSLAPWLHTVAYRLAVRTRTAAARRPTVDARDLDMLPAAPDAAGAWRDLRPILDEELQRLPEKYRAPVVLCYLEGRTHAEAAAQLGWPLGTVAGRLARARNVLRDRLTRRGVTLSAALLGTVLAEHAAATTLPAGLASAAVRGAVAFALASTVGISAKVAALAEGGLHAMFAAKVKLGATLVLAVLVALAGVGVWAQQALREEPAEEARADAGQQPAKAEAAQMQLDRHGDPLPEGAVARLGTVRWRRSGTGNLIVSPDGKTLASRDEGYCLSVWDVNTGKPIRRTTEVRSYYWPLGFSADGKRLICFARDFEKNAVRVLEVDSGKEVRRTPLSTGDYQAVLSADGKLLATFGNNPIRLYEADTGKEVQILQDSILQSRGNRVNAFSPDGRYVVGQFSGTREQEDRITLCLWDVATGKKVRTIGEPHPHGGWIGATFSWDGKLLAIGRKEAIELWDVTTGLIVRRLTGQPGPLFFLAFTRDNKRLVSGRADSAIRVWDIETGRELHKLSDGIGILFSPGDDQYAGLVLTPDDQFVAAAWHHTIRLWDLRTGKEVPSFDGHHHSVRAVSLSGDGKTVVSVDVHGGLHSWDAATGRPLGNSRVNRNEWPRFSPGGEVLATFTGAERPLLVLRDSASGKEIRQLALQPAGGHADLYGLAFSPDGATLAVCHGAFSLPFPIQRKPRDYYLSLWDVATGKELWRRGNLPFHGIPAFSPDGASFAFNSTFSEKVIIEMWSVSAGQPSYQIHGEGKPLGRIDPVLYSPRGQLLFCSSREHPRARNREDGVVDVWEVASGQSRGQFVGHKGLIKAGAVSPDARTVATCGEDETIRVWDATTCQELVCLRGHAGMVRCLAYSRDGRHLLSGGDDTTVLVWDVDSLLRAAPTKVVRSSSKEIEVAWVALAGADAKTAHRAIHTLASAPELTMPFMRQRLRPAADNAEQLARWVKELDDARFEVREQASRQLEAAGHAAEELLKQTLTKAPSPESRQRVEALIQKLRGPVTQPELLRAIRAVEVLEQIGTPETRAVLKTLADGTAAARLTREANSALRFLERREAK